MTTTGTRRSAQKVKSLTFVWPTDPGQISSGFQTGNLGGGFFLNATAIPLLKASSAGKLYLGPPSQTMAVMALIVVGTKGAIANRLVRHALNLSIDRAALIKIAESGVGTPGYADASPGYFSYERSQYAAAYAASRRPEAMSRWRRRSSPRPAPTPRNRSSSRDPGGVGDRRRRADRPTERRRRRPSPHAQDRSARPVWRALRRPLGSQGERPHLHDQLRQDHDPLAVYSDIALPHGISNFAGYDNKTVARLLTRARMTTNLAKRAQLRHRRTEARDERSALDSPRLPAQHDVRAKFGVCRSTSGLLLDDQPLGGLRREAADLGARN